MRPFTRTSETIIGRSIKPIMCTHYTNYYKGSDANETAKYNLLVDLWSDLGLSLRGVKPEPKTSFTKIPLSEHFFFL